MKELQFLKERLEIASIEAQELGVKITEAKKNTKNYRAILRDMERNVGVIGELIYIIYQLEREAR